MDDRNDEEKLEKRFGNDRMSAFIKKKFMKLDIPFKFVLHVILLISSFNPSILPSPLPSFSPPPLYP